MFLKEIDMAFMEPCVADPEHVRVFARMSTDIRELMPYLNAVIRNATYNRDWDTMCFTKGVRLVTLYPEKIAIAKALNPTDAWQLLDWIKDTVNETYENRDSIKPNYDRRDGITALDIFEFLPRLDCGQAFGKGLSERGMGDFPHKCGEPTCLAFAVKLLLDERRIEECGPLFTAEYSRLRKVVLDLVAALGHEVPEH